MFSKDKIKGFILGMLFFTLLSVFSLTVFASPVSRSIAVIFDNIRIVVDGIERVPPGDMMPFIHEGRVFVSLRFVAEALGKKVTWDGAGKRVFVSDTSTGTVSFETIEMSSHSGYEENKIYVIRQDQEWNLLRDKVRVSLPDINFAQYMVIAAFQGIRNTGGYSIRIMKIIEDQDNVTVYITETSPGPDDIVIQVLTDPFHIVKLERFAKNIQFKITQELIRGAKR